MLDFRASRAELPLLVFNPLSILLADDHRQHLLVYVDSCYATIYRFHVDLLVIVCGRGPVSLIAVTLTGSPSDAIARTPIHRFVPRSQIKHSYGFAISSACDNLYCRHRSLPFSSPLLCGTQWQHSCVPRRDSSRRLDLVLAERGGRRD